MIYKMMFILFFATALIAMTVVCEKIDQLSNDLKQTHRELKRQGDEFRNANGFDLDNVPCHVLEAADGVIRCHKRDKQ